MKKVIVTGGAGFIGANLCKKLVSLGHRVISLDNYSTGSFDNQVKGAYYFNADICDKSKLEIIGDADVVYHLAALARIQPSFLYPKLYFNSNVVGTFNLCDACQKNSVPIILSGSSSHHSGKFKNPYTFTKDVSEELLTLYDKIFNLKQSVARFYNVYGPKQLVDGPYCTVVGVFMNQYEEKQDITITWDGEQRRDFTHVYDIVNGLILSGEKLVDGEVNGQFFELGSGENYSINQLAEAFGEHPKVKIPKRPGEMRETLCTDTLANELLGWEPKENLIKWVKETI